MALMDKYGGEKGRERGREGEIKGRGRHKLEASGCPRVTMDAKGFTMKDIHTHTAVLHYYPPIMSVHAFNFAL